MATSPTTDNTGLFATESQKQRAGQMYYWDRLRGGASGVVETCWQVFALLVAIRVFDADESVKQFIPAAGGLGLLLSPFSLSLFNNVKGRIATLLAALWFGIALSLLGMILAPNVLLFVLAASLAQIFSTQGVPLLTHLYSRNYSAKVRGSRLSTTFLIGSLVGIGFGYGGGELMDMNDTNYRIVFGLGILATLICCFASYRLPSDAATTLQSRNVFRSLAVAWEDKIFGIVLFAWMLMGIGNLMLIPLRVEYLANPAYGINASNSQISLLLVSIVLTFRVLSTKVWGFLFDRMNMITLRVLLNIVFVGSIAFFFFSTNFILMGIGTALLGMAFGGGRIMWTLYVTKMAPPDKVTSYMSVHGFLTGARMAIAPFLGYNLLVCYEPRTVAIFAIILIVVSSAIFLPLKPIIEKRSNSLDSL